MSAIQLTITPLKLSELPSEEALLEAGKELIDGISGWKEGKKYQLGSQIQTLWRGKNKGDGAPWHARASEHSPDEATFDEFWAGLGVDKAENELNFTNEMQKVTLVKRISSTQNIWTFYYKLPPPVSARVFTALQTIHLDEVARTGLIVSVPIDLSEDLSLLSLEEKGIKGRYVSVERLTELPDKSTRWEMATSNTPGGSIPSFLSESSMPGQIAGTVPAFLKWAKEARV